MTFNLNTNWDTIFNLYTDELKIIMDKVDKERNLYEPGLKIFPENDKIFQAFKYFNIEDLKVVFIGQDCYHGKEQANGLAFSVPEHVPNPPSLRNILKEMLDDVKINRASSNFGDLAKQGILFLNSSLTVREKCPESHLHIWCDFTNKLIKKISDISDKVIFVLWGNYAKEKKNLIDIDKHFILESVHPSPLSAYRGFFGCKHFSKINNKLEEWDKNVIEWNDIKL